MENGLIQGMAGGILMNLPAIIGLIILIGLAALLIVPWRIRLSGATDHQGGLSYAASLDWALGAVRVAGAAGQPWRLYIVGLPVAHFPGLSKAGKKKKERKSSPLAFARIIKRYHRTMIGVLDRIAGAAFLRGHLLGRIGLPDPADTAQLALLCRWMELSSKHFNLKLDWVYDQEIVQIQADLSATVIIGYLLLTAGLLLLDRQTRMMLRSLRHA